MLAQSALVTNGTVSMLGGGWTQIGPGPAPFAIAGVIEMPWEAAGVSHNLRFDLLDDQGQPVIVETPDGRQPVVIEGQFDVAPQPGLKKGTPLTMPIAINLPPQPLGAGLRFEWRLEIDGETHEDWRLGFNTLPLVQSRAA
jgi:hypothetical protein